MENRHASDLQMNRSSLRNKWLKFKTLGKLRITLEEIRATSHTRLRARDHSTSSTLIGGKGGAKPSSLHTTLEEPTECVDARWM